MLIFGLSLKHQKLLSPSIIFLLIVIQFIYFNSVPIIFLMFFVCVCIYITVYTPGDPFPRIDRGRFITCYIHIFLSRPPTFSKHKKNQPTPFQHLTNLSYSCFCCCRSFVPLWWFVSFSLLGVFFRKNKKINKEKYKSFIHHTTTMTTYYHEKIDR